MPTSLAAARPRNPSQIAAPPAPVPGGEPGTFRHDVEGMRALAMLLVVVFHAGVPFLQGGYVGVDVFFVLSGYLITGLIVREIETRGRLDLLHFYARRTRRLLPGAALMLAVTALVGLMVLSPLEQWRVSESGAATSLYASNLWFMWRTGDYFITGAEGNPLLHTWSLAVEEQFYLVWPVAVWLMFRGRSRARLAGWMAALSLASLALCLWLTELRQPWAFYFSPTRAWEFGVGGLLALAPAAWLAGRRRAAQLLGWLGMVAIAVAAVTYSAATRFPGAYAVLPALGTAAVLVAGTAPPGALQRVLSWWPFQHLGRLSYSWYLWHWPALVFAGVLLPEPSVPVRLLVALLSLGVAALAYAWVENPVRSHPRLAARPGASLRLGLALTLGSLAVMAAWNRVADRRAHAPAFLAYTRAAEDGERGACLVPMTNSWEPECVAGDLRGGTTVVLFGDSHASHWYPAIESIARERGWRLVTLMKSGCPAAGVEVVNSRLRREYTECTEWRRQALARIHALRPDAVVMASALVYVRGPGRQTPASHLSYAEWRDGTRRTAAGLDALGIRTVVIHNTPRPGVHIPTCLSRAAHRGQDPVQACSRPRALALDDRVHQAEREGLRGLRFAASIDLSPWFCGRTACEPVRDGVVVYRDRGHLTASYASHLRPVLMPRLALLVE